MQETAARASDAVEEAELGVRLPSNSFGIVQRCISLSVVDSTNGSRKGSTRDDQETVQPSARGQVLTHRGPQMNMLQDGHGHLNQAVVLRIELSECVVKKI